MALLIKDNCVDCDICEPECPNLAISYDGDISKTVIDPARCTECKGHYDKPTCIAVCPIDCIIVDPKNVETEDQLYDKFVGLHEELLLTKG